MKISTLIVVMGVIGALTAAMVTREQMLDVAESQKESFNSINTKLYASAWTNKSEQSWQDYLDQYNPDGFSEDYEGIFTPDSDMGMISQIKIGANPRTSKTIYVGCKGLSRLVLQQVARVSHRIQVSLPGRVDTTCSFFS